MDNRLTRIVFTRNEKFILIFLAVTFLTVIYWFFFLKERDIEVTCPDNYHSVESVPVEPVQELVPPVPDIPLLPSYVVERISDGEVFLMLWHNGKFEKFSELSTPRFDNSKPAVVLIHGLFESATNKWLANMAARIAEVEPDTIILVVDWSKFSLKGAGFSWETVITAYAQIGSGGDVTNAEWWRTLTGIESTRQMRDVANVVQSIPPVADIAAEYLFAETGLQLKPDATHIIGFSHGAHVGGLIGRNTDGILRRLTVLDPSMRLVHFKGLNMFGTGWDSQSARFTDMYRTSFWAGTGTAYGHRTYTVLEPGEQRLLPTVSPAKDTRRHNYATEWFATTVGEHYLDYGYSMTIPDDAIFQEGVWSGTIIGR